MYQWYTTNTLVHSGKRRNDHIKKFLTYVKGHKTVSDITICLLLDQAVLILGNHWDFSQNIIYDANDLLIR